MDKYCTWRMYFSADYLQIISDFTSKKVCKNFGTTLHAYTLHSVQQFACLSIERWLHVVGNVKLIFKRNFYSIKNILSHIQMETSWFHPLNKYKKLVLKCRRNLIPKEVRLFIFSWVQSTSENLITEMNFINNV